MNLKVTTVWQKNWDAIHKPCRVCGGSGMQGAAGCTRCGDGYLPGTGRDYKYIINTGSSRSSKTYSLIDCFDVYARQNKGKRLTVWRDTKTDCKKTVLADALKHLKSTRRYIDSFFNKTESIFNYKNGSTFEIHGTDDENTVHGLTQDAAWLNEPYKISREVFDQIDQRTSDFVIIDWNPRKAHWIEDIAKDPRAIVINSTFRDNPFCPPEQRKKILSYQPVKMCDVVVSGLLTEQQAREYGIAENKLLLSPAQIDELVRCRQNEDKNSANEYNWSVYGLGLKAERPNRIFHWNEIPLEDYLAIDVPVYYYSDWGAVDPWAIGEVKYYDGALYVREKNYESENNIRARLTPVEWEIITGRDEGIVSWQFARLGIDYDKTIICDTNRPMKILALREAGWDYAVGLSRKDTGASKSMVVDGIDLINNIPVYFTSDSPNIKYEQENYSRKVDRYGIVLEEPEDTDNHHMDGIRYVATFLQAEGIISKI